MLAIYKKELRSYFITPVGWVYCGVFLAAAALLLCYTTLLESNYDTSEYFTLLIFSFVILIPLLTMKLFAEEKKLRTEQLLLTAPVTLWGMVLGKFLAAATMFLGTLAVSCVNFFPLYVYAYTERQGDPYAINHIGPVTGRIVGCLVGVALIGLAFIAIGIFISSLTENQLSAAVISIAVILFMIVMSVVNAKIEIYWVRVVIDWICVLSRFSAFANGYLDFSAMLYYLSLAGVFLLLTVRVYDKRRWG